MTKTPKDLSEHDKQLTAIRYWIEDREEQDSPWESEIREINLLKWAVKTITAQQKEIARLCSHE